MPISEENNGTTYYNINTCRSFNIPVTTALKALSSQPCSEAIIINKTGQIIYLYDQGFATDDNRIELANNETFTLRGVTNSNMISAKTATGSGLVYFRTQFYSLLPQR